MNTTHFRFVSALLLPFLFAPLNLIAEVKVIDLGGHQFLAKFSFTAPPNAKSVHLAGSFNQWNPKTLAMEGPNSNGRFVVEVAVARGRYEYKFVVNSQTWMTDPDNDLKTGPNQNAVLLAGVQSDSDAAARDHQPQLVMPGQTDHPQVINDLIQQLSNNDTASSQEPISAWFNTNRMPYFTDSSVTFAFHAAGLESVRLSIVAPGGRLGYRLAPLITAPAGEVVYGVTLEKNKIPTGAAYVLELVGKKRTRRIVDPNAWSVTSRHGTPAGRIVEPSEKVGRIELIEDLTPTNSELKPRDVYVYLPPGYDASSDHRYPVVYLHDGQNCWDDPSEPFGHGGWSINLIADKLISENAIRPFIAVGIANTPDRLTEYGPGKDILSASAQPYLQFLASELKPMIDRRYQTRPGPQDTALMGSSMGGAISFQGALLLPDVFGAAACLSTAFLFEDAKSKDYTDLVRSRGKQPIRLYLDSGTGGRHQDGAPATRAMVQLLIDTGWSKGVDLEHFEDTGAAHNERAWRARVDRPLKFLFAPSS